MSCRLICLAVLGASLAAGGKAKALEPIQNWVLDYREDQCLASRDYGSAADPVTLGIRPAPNGQTYELMAARRGSGPEFATEKKGSVDFGNGPINAWLLNYGGALTKADVMQFRISALEMRQALTAKTVTLRESGRPQLSFTLAAMPALLKGMQECTADLQQHWNMGEREKVIATQARGDLRGLFDPGDYPAEALQRHQEGSVRFLLLVNEAGRVSGCHVLQPSGVPVLDAMGCQVLRKRATFTPARDAAGKAVRTAVTTPLIVWRLQPTQKRGSRLLE
jgi:TonB family protein